MAFWTRLFGGKEPDEPPSMPWDRRPSILEFVRSHICADKPGMAEDGYTLPDDESVNSGSKIRWGMGSMDGVITHHFGTGENEAAVRKTVELVLAYSRQPTANNKAAVYQHVIAEHVVSIIEPHVRAFDITGKPMRNWVAVEPEGVEDDDQLKAWIERATKFVRTLPKK